VICVHFEIFPDLTLRPEDVCKREEELAGEKVVANRIIAIFNDALFSLIWASTATVSTSGFIPLHPLLEIELRLE